MNSMNYMNAYENLEVTYELVKEEDDEELQSELETEVSELNKTIE